MERVVAQEAIEKTVKKEGMITHVKGCWVVHYDEDLEVPDGFRSVKVAGDLDKSHFHGAVVKERRYRREYVCIENLWKKYVIKRI